MKSNGEKSKIRSLFSAAAITVGLVWVFFKLPGIIANKISLNYYPIWDNAAESRVTTILFVIIVFT